MRTFKSLVIAGLFLVAVCWVSLMGLVSWAGGQLQAGGGAARGGLGPWTDDGTIKAEVVHVDRQGFKIGVALKITGPDGKVLGGLGEQDIEIREDGVPVTFGKFNGAGQAPVRVCVVMDYSGSMNGKKIEGAKAAALALLDMLRDNTDHLGLYLFNGAQMKNSGSEKLAMGPLDPTRREQARQAITGTPLAGGTPMFGSMEKAIEGLKNSSGRRLLVVMTDGMDTQYKGARFDERIGVVTTSTKQLNVPIYMISLMGGKSDETGMKKLAEQGNGKYIYAPTPEKLKDIYVNIGETLQNEYFLEYDSPNPVEDGLTRNLTVTVRKGDSGAQAKSDYHVPGVIATGGSKRPAHVEGSAGAPPVERAPPPFATVILPLATLLGMLFAVPYYVWLRR